MKYYLLLLLLLAGCLVARGQGAKSIIPFTNSSTKKTTEASDKQKIDASSTSDNSVFDPTSLPTIGIYGIGNTNTETFNNINSSGKLSGYMRGLKTKSGYFQLDFAFNVNASNTDSLLASTLLFPDIGKNSFSATATYNWVIKDKTSTAGSYLVSPFFEFSDKNIKGTKADSTRSFFTLNSTLGVSLQYLFVSGTDKASFSVSPYLNWVHVPDPGASDYRYLFTGDENNILKGTIHSYGVKAAFQYNNFQIFADFRNVTGNKDDYPVPGLLGFHQNIGIIFNADIFEK